MREDLLLKSARSSLTLNQRRCVECGAPTTSAVYCYRCYRASEAGLAENRYAHTIRKYKPQLDGGPCKHCIHWAGYCTLGLPEGGTLAALQLCSARQLDSLLE
jgi:hypothetical protein